MLSRPASPGGEWNLGSSARVGDAAPSSVPSVPQRSRRRQPAGGRRRVRPQLARAPPEPPPAAPLAPCSRPQLRQLLRARPVFLGRSLAPSRRRQAGPRHLSGGPCGRSRLGQGLRTAERPELPERKGGEKETGASELLEASWQAPKARAALDVCCHRFTAVAPSSATEVPDRQKESRAVCPYKCVVLTSVGKKSSKTAAFLIPRSCIL
ncbi:uncharacterized protein [Patagioenas fasciata]|uniref:uncharacterized protein n=1 Tax=Patagioenas fasciata TaxID=372321 RepID=UPI003A991FF9